MYERYKVDHHMLFFYILIELMKASFMYEQVAVSTKRTATSQIPNYPNLPSQLLCQVQNVTLHVCVLSDFLFLFLLHMYELTADTYVFFTFSLHILIGRQRYG